MLVLGGLPLSVWLGILSFLFLTVTVMTGLRIIKVNLKIHRRLALTTLALALTHALVVIFAYYG
jgi:hypothetical protein